METPRNDEAIGFNGFGQIGGTAFRQYLSLPPDQRSGRTIINEWLALDKMQFLAAVQELIPPGARLDGMPDDHSVRIILKDGSDIVVSLFNWKEGQDMRWRNEDIRSVIDASRSPEQTAPDIVEHGGAEEVLMTGPSKKFPEVLRGINENVVTLDTKILSNGSCTTKACAPVIQKILHAVEQGQLPPIDNIVITGTHAATNTDSFVGRLGEPALADNLVASSTGSIGALQRIFREQLEGKISGNVIRVPVSEGSIVNLTITFKETPSWANPDATAVGFECGPHDGRALSPAEARGKLRNAILATIFEAEEPEDVSLFGLDHEAQPQIRSHRDDTRPSVILKKLITGEGRTIVIPVRYNNVLASGNEAVLMMQRIQAIRGELAAKIGG